MQFDVGVDKTTLGVGHFENRVRAQITNSRNLRMGRSSDRDGCTHVGTLLRNCLWRIRCATLAADDATGFRQEHLRVRCPVSDVTRELHESVWRLSLRVDRPVQGRYETCVAHLPVLAKPTINHSTTIRHEVVSSLSPEPQAEP